MDAALLVVNVGECGCIPQGNGRVVAVCIAEWYGYECHHTLTQHKSDAKKKNVLSSYEGSLTLCCC